MKHHQGLRQGGTIIALPATLINVSVTSLVLVTILSIPAFPNQDVDPFYLRLLTEGEKSFLAQNHRETVQTLEIAAFGLSREKELLGKASTYLALSYHHLKDRQKCEWHLKNVIRLFSPDEFHRLEIDRSARQDFIKLVDLSKLAWENRTQEVSSTTDQALPSAHLAPPTDSRQKPNAARFQALEKSIKKEPDNISLYHELAELYRQKNDLKSAKRWLQALAKKFPDDPLGIFLSARLEYLQKNYRPALSAFHRLLSPSFQDRLDQDLNLKSVIYVSLCLHHLKLRDSLISYLEYLAEMASETLIALILREEGLEKQWAEMKARSKIMPPL